MLAKHVNFHQDYIMRAVMLSQQFTHYYCQSGSKRWPVSLNVDEGLLKYKKDAVQMQTQVIKFLKITVTVLCFLSELQDEPYTSCTQG